MTSDIAPVDRSNCEHYVWGAGCDGWRLLASAALSVIQERVPPGASEVMHFHSEAQQFFFVLSGHATLELEDRSVELGVGQGLRVPPRVPHRFGNRSGRDVVFLVISSPTSAGDRTDLTGGGSGCTRDSAST